MSHIETDWYIMVKLQEPYWGAASKYGWSKGVEGFGVDEVLVKQAKRDNKTIRVLSGPGGKWGEFEIDPAGALVLADNYKSYQIRRGVKLMVLPRDRFAKITNIALGGEKYGN